MTPEPRYSRHNYKYMRETPEQSARRILKTIEKCQLLKDMRLKGFIGGVEKGKCPTVLGDSLPFLYRDLEKQIFDFHVALAQGKPLKQELANLVNVAECLFVKLDHLKKE